MNGPNACSIHHIIQNLLHRDAHVRTLLAQLVVEGLVKGGHCRRVLLVLVGDLDGGNLAIEVGGLRLGEGPVGVDFRLDIVLDIHPTREDRGDMPNT